MPDLRDRKEAHFSRQGSSARAAIKASAHRNVNGIIPLVRRTENAFASSKHGFEYSQKIEASMSRYHRLAQRRRNLFAFVLPAGHGKTHYAAKYGFIDVDTLIEAKDHNRLTEMRFAVMAGQSTWSTHNAEFYRLLNKTLDLVDYSAPVIILLHHEEAALELGAVILGGFRLNKINHELNIRNRSADDRYFSTANYLAWGSMVKTPNKIDGLDNKNLERLILKTLCVNNLPVAAPNTFEVNNSVYYKQQCPSWILEGTKPQGRPVDLGELVELYERKIIPRQAVDYYVHGGYTATGMDFGITMNDWAPLLARVAAASSEFEEFNANGNLMEIFPPREVKESTRSNVTLRRLDETFGILDHEDVYTLCGHHVGEPHVFVSGIVSAWKGLLAETGVAHIIAPWFKVNYEKWSKIMKDLHTFIRASKYFMNTPITEGERQRLMYLDLLVGRASYIINEMSEVDKRGGDTHESEHLSYDPVLQLYTRDQYKLDFDKAVKRAYSRMKYSKQPRLNVRSFRDFFARRKTWLTKGSLVYNHIPVDKRKTVVQAIDSVNATLIEIESRHNKQSLFEEMDLSEFLRYAGEAKDFNVTKTMVKFETGRKDRTLLPGSLTHFLVMTYVLELAERLEQVGSVRLNGMADEDFRMYDKKMVTGLFHVLYDWADFNEQHSADEMAAVITELDNVVQAPADYTYFVQAIASSMYDMKLQDRDGNRHSLVSGLYSGWRGTTWINSVLNFCYVDVAMASFFRIYGYDPVVYMDHGGDDIDNAVDSAVSMPRFMAVMDNMLFNANVWKQMFSYRSEFFRNTITSSRAYASPTRALASFCAGDWEGSGNLTVRERVTNILDQTGKMCRRGVPHDFANGLALCALTHWCKIKREDSWVNMPKEVIHGREEDGGLGVPDWDGSVWELDKPVPDMSDIWLTMLRPSMLSSRDYVAELSKDVESLSMVLVRKEELAARLAKDAYDADLKVDRLNWANIVSFKATVKSKIPVVTYRRNDHVFDDFLYFQMSDQLIRKYGRASRYTELTGHLTANGRELSREDIISMVGGGQVVPEAIDFSGSPYYRRLVPDFLGQKITYFCREIINNSVGSVDDASDIFEILCCMCREVFGHEM